MAIKQEANVPLVLTIGIVTGIVLIVLVIGVEGWYASEENDELAAKSDLFPNVELIDLQKTQNDRIASYHWVDQKNNVVAIPIERAMQVMVETNGNPPATQPAQP